MKIDIGQPLLSYTGEAMQGRDGPATLQNTLEMALANCTMQEFASGERKYELYQLLQKVHDAKGIVELTAEQIATLKKVAGAGLGVVAVGAVYDALEGKAGTKE